LHLYGNSSFILGFVFFFGCGKQVGEQHL